MYVMSVFLNGELEYEIYVTQPHGFVAKGQEDKMSKLQKSLYDMKQTSKQWYEKFDFHS
jgi:hypothetical protein